MIDLALLSLIIADNPDVEINIRISPEDYCRKYPQDYACNPRRSRYADFLAIQRELKNNEKK